MYGRRGRVHPDGNGNLPSGRAHRKQGTGQQCFSMRITAAVHNDGSYLKNWLNIQTLCLRRQGNAQHK